MEFKSLDELSAFIDLCRKKGIQDIKLGAGGIELHLQEITPRKRRQKTDGTPEIAEKPYTDDELLFWSSAGVPEVQG